MDTSLNPTDKELYKRTDEVLHYIWDPIGVAGSPYAREEYWGYLPQVFTMLIDEEPNEALVHYLLNIEKESMGLSPDRARAEIVVRILKEYKEKIDLE